MAEERRLVRLIDCAYGAVSDPSAWGRFAELLSAELEDAPIAVCLELPGAPSGQGIWSVGLREGYGDRFGSAFFSGLPWKREYVGHYNERFADSGEMFQNLELTDTAFYADWMKPQGLAAHWPVGIALGDERGRLIGALALYRRDGMPPFGPEVFALGEELAPHFVRAFWIFRRLGGERLERLALGQVMDRLPLGVLLLDAEGRVVVTNRSAQRILSLADGLVLDEGRVRATERAANAKLQNKIAEATRAGASGAAADSHVMPIARPSGRRSYPLMVSPLLEEPQGGDSGNAVAVIFVSNYDAHSVSFRDALRALYDLTAAEAELVGLIAEGSSLEHAARARGVTVNTARSQLKQVFAKTGTRRQGELVRVVLSGVASIRRS